MDTKNVVQVQIFGHSYTIKGEADHEYIMGVATYVDRKMREVTEKLPVASLSKVAILASTIDTENKPIKKKILERVKEIFS